MSKGAGGLGWNSSEARGFSLKTIIRSEKKKKEKEGKKKPNSRLAHISMLTRKLGVFYLFCSADRIIMNLGHWKSSYLEGYSFSHPPHVFTLYPPFLPRLWSSSSARMKSRSGVDDNSIS